MTTRLWVDFNEVYDDDYVWTSLRNTASVIHAPSPGDWIELHDDSGEGCWALITEVDGPIVSCKIDWSTWRSVRSSLVQSATGSGKTDAILASFAPTLVRS